MVKVKPTASQGRITVRSNNDTTVFGIKDNLSEYYAKLSERWANSPDMVNGIDYSSKHYAEEARTSAETSSNYVNEIQEVYSRIADDVNEAQITINDLKNNSINHLTNVGSLLTEQISEKASEISELMDENCKSLPMFTPIWSDHILNDASYLRADTFSWHNGDIYVTGYSIIEREYNNENCIIETENGVTYKRTPNGFKIANVDQQEAIVSLYENNGKTWFYIIDTEVRAFKLPREKNISGKCLYFFIGNYARPATDINIGELVEVVNNIDFEATLENAKNEMIAVKNNCITDVNNTALGAKADRDLSNLTENGENKLNSILNNKITNCLLEVPQNIKLELNNGVLTLKAGSKVYDGNGLFAEITNDISNPTPAVNSQVVVMVANGVLCTAFMGESVTELPVNASTYKIFYNTTDKKCYLDSKSGWIPCSFPIALATGTTTNWTSIDQVFNGMGYIGSIVWVAKGIKGLIPNGRNEDGTLKNIELTTTKVTINIIDANWASQDWFIDINGVLTWYPLQHGQIVYNEETNTWINSWQGGINLWFPVGKTYATGGKITSLEPKQPVRLVDHNDLGAFLPVGTVFSHTCSASFVPENSLPCNGSEYTQAQFPNLYNDWLVSGKLKTCTYTEYSNMLTTYGQCPMWALDTTNNKFKVPTIKNGSVIQQAMSDTELGKAYNAGLPNITGSINGHGLTNGSLNQATGAFYSDSANTAAHANCGGSGNPGFGFNASRSSSIYGNSNTVQPNAVALRYFVVVATKAINTSAMDWSNWASSLNGKLNADHSNDAKPYVIQTYVNGLSWYRVWSDGWCEQGGQVSNSDGSGFRTVTYLKPYINEPNVVVTQKGSYYGAGYSGQHTDNVQVSTPTYCTIYVDGNIPYRNWRACGYIN